MAFKDFPDQHQALALLQRSLQRKRLAHAYLFIGHELRALEVLARTLAKTLNCLQPVRQGKVAVDCCDECLPCRKIEHGNHPDVHWARPESKTRVVTVDQMRDLMKEIQLKPGEAEYKVAIIVAADRLNVQAANAFLKTLEEPPEKSVLILLSTQPERVLETIVSRCLRLNFGAAGAKGFSPQQLEWLSNFTRMAAVEQKSLMGRYRLLDVLLKKLAEMKAEIDANLSARSPLEQYKDAEKETVEQWESELAAAVEAEYRSQRADLLGLLQCWLRDVWLTALSRNGVGDAKGGGLLNFPDLHDTAQVARRVSVDEARQNLEALERLQRTLHTNVQEALALEVGLLNLKL